MENTSPTSDIRGHRTLATVVFTDCVGFSARMSEDEDLTLDLISRDLKLMKRVCRQFEGRVLKSTGDGLLMHFNSAVKAVECAVEIQRTIAQTAGTLPVDKTLQHRIGIHLADMFITETDVMGNGVNIAARLQSIAHPGGICISQTVYDVVRAGLHLPTRYLGPQELKNIREVVPAYEVLLTPNADLDPIAQVVQKLEQHRSTVRIKKLLFFICLKTWESDVSKLDEVPLGDLLAEMLKLNPTLQQLERFLESAVRSLSKPAEYSLVANLIVETVKPLYRSPSQSRSPTLPPTSEHTQAVGPSPQDELQAGYAAIAHELEQTGNVNRAKKLIFYVCRNRWESDPHQLESLQLPELLAELYQLAPTLESLRSRMHQFAQTLSKQAEYMLLANTIVQKFQRLYAPAASGQTGIAAELLSAPLTPPIYGEVIAALNQAPNTARIKKLILYVCRQQWESDTGKLTGLDISSLVEELHHMASTIAQLEATLNAIVRTLNKPAEYGVVAQTIIRIMGRLYLNDRFEAEAPLPTVAPVDSFALVAPPEPLPPANSVAELSPSGANLDLPASAAFCLFEARLGIMKYANPLRTKILLFSALQTDFNFSSQDWLNLRMSELDSLLRQLLNICKSYTDLEALLYSTARRLHTPEEHVDIANVVIKCLRTYYLYGGSVGPIGVPAEETKVKLDFDETRLELDAADEDDHTCQLLPAVEQTAAIAPSCAIVAKNPAFLPPAPLPLDQAGRATISYPPANSPANLGEVHHAGE